MKLKPQLLLLTLAPMVLVAVVALILVGSMTPELVADELEKTMSGMATELRDSYNNLDAGEYALRDAFGDQTADTNGKVLYKGETNICETGAIVDNIKNSAGAEATIFFGDTRYITTLKKENKRIIGSQTTDENVKSTVLKDGKAYFDTALTINDVVHYAYYLPIFDSNNKVVGMSFIGFAQDKIKDGINSMMFTIIGIVVGIAAVAFVIGYIISNGIVKATKKTETTLEELSNGNLRISIDQNSLKRKDEIGSMIRATDILKNRLSSTLGNIIAQSGTLTSSADSLEEMAKETATTIEQVETAVTDIANGATNQADETSNASNHVVKMGEMINDTVKDAESLQENAQLMKASTGEATSSLNALKEINSKAISAIDVIYEQTNTTNESAMKIKEATTLITSIASETALLSLNASIEAARAGEQGRGFAVVADQIQKLAEQVNNTAKEIDDIIIVLLNDSNEAVHTMDGVKVIMNEQSEKLDHTEEKFNEVKDGIDKSIEGVENITSRTKELDRTRVSVIDIVQNLTAIAEENAATTEETSAATAEVSATVTSVSAAASDVKNVVNELEQNIGVFKL